LQFGHTFCVGLTGVEQYGQYSMESSQFYLRLLENFKLN
jgi:hypothetical protein